MALTDVELQEIKTAVREAMKEKIEITFGVNCADEEERASTRKDMDFLHSLREKVEQGNDRLLWWIIGIVGTGILLLLFPSLKDYLKGP